MGRFAGGETKGRQGKWGCFWGRRLWKFVCEWFVKAKWLYLVSLQKLSACQQFHHYHLQTSNACSIPVKEQGLPMTFTTPSTPSQVLVTCWEQLITFATRPQFTTMLEMEGMEVVNRGRTQNTVKKCRSSQKEFASLKLYGVPVTYRITCRWWEALTTHFRVQYYCTQVFTLIIREAVQRSSLWMLLTQSQLLSPRYSQEWVNRQCRSHLIS